MEISAKREKNKFDRLSSVGLVLIFVAIVAFLLFLLNGETVVTGELDESKVSDTLVCESNSVPYSVFAFDDSDSKNLKINAVFEDGELSSISLIYKLNYSDLDALNFSEARNHAEINKSFRSDGMNPDSLSAKYGILSDGMQFSIYAEDDDISEKVLKYFMLNGIDDMSKLDKEKMAEVYVETGLNCVAKNNKTKEEVNEN